VLTTEEPYQPVRLAYRLGSCSAVRRALGRLRCIQWDASAGEWVWLYIEESAGLTFGKARAELPPEVHPIVIGRLRLVGEDGLTVNLRSVDRALVAVRFFKPVLGRHAALGRLRIVNRWFSGKEARRGLATLDATLDRDVVVVDPDAFMKRVAKRLETSGSAAERLAALEAVVRESGREDVPLVEDLPLYPEEEDDEFTQLVGSLRLRYLRAAEHWMGNTHVTLGDLIAEVAERMSG